MHYGSDQDAHELIVNAPPWSTVVWIIGFLSAKPLCQNGKGGLRKAENAEGMSARGKG
jgi:hypothetical protein